MGYPLSFPSFLPPFLTMASEQQQQQQQQCFFVTLPAADLVCKTGTIYNDDFENFFEEQYFEGDVLPAGSADSSLPASSLDFGTFESCIHDSWDTKLKQKLTICVVPNTTV